MYRAPEAKIVGEFNPPAWEGLVDKNERGKVIPYATWKDQPWTETFRPNQAHARFWVDGGKKLGLSHNELARVLRWHCDRLSRTGNPNMPTRTIMASTILGARTLGGVVSGLPDISTIGGQKEIVNLDLVEVDQAVKEAIIKGDAWSIDLEPNVVYQIKGGQLHSSPPLKSRGDITRFVGVSFLELPAPHLTQPHHM